MAFFNLGGRRKKFLRVAVFFFLGDFFPVFRGGHKSAKGGSFTFWGYRGGSPFGCKVMWFFLNGCKKTFNVLQIILSVTYNTPMGQ